MIKPITMWQVRCDGCGCIMGDSSGDCIAWESKDSAEYIAEESNWRKLGKGIFCPDCYSVDDNDNYVPVYRRNQHKNEQ